MKQIGIIKADTEEELIKLLNEYPKETFATQIMQKNDDSWVAFVYYYAGKTQKEAYSKQNPDEDGNKPTEKQINFLIKNKYNGDIESLTRKEATELISEFISKRNKEL